MEVILLQKIGRLGNLGDKVAVKAGFARNYLVPEGKAVFATADNLTKFEARRAELEKIAAANLKEAQTRAEKLQNLAITISARAADEGRLYGSLGTRDIADAIGKAGIEIEKSEIRLPNGPIRLLGEHEIIVQLHSDVTTQVKVNVVPDA